MKKHFIFSLFILLITSCLAYAQYDANVTSGVVAFNQGDYDMAIEKLETAIDHVAELKDNNKPKAYYYYGKSLIRAMGKAASSNNQQKLDQYSENLLKAYEAFKNAQKADDGRWGKKINEEMRLLNQSYLQAALQSLNAANSGSYDSETTQQLYENARQYLNISREIDDNYYVTYDLLGQVELALLDSSDAIKSFRMSVMKYDENPPAKPDLLMAYAYYRMALLERYLNKDNETALKLLREGKEKVNSIWSEIEKNKGVYEPSVYSRYEQQYTSAMQDLQNFELDIYLNSPEKLDEAIAAFEADLKKDPDNYLKQVAYAQLLEKVDHDRSVAAYKKAIEIDPTRQLAHFNLGAIILNKGVQYYKQANETDDLNKASELQAKGDEMFKKALPHLERAAEIKPDDLNTLQALKQITVNLQMTEKYNKYNEMYKQATGY